VTKAPSDEHDAFNKALKKLTAGIKPGDVVEVAVKRGEETTTATATAIGVDAYRELRDAYEAESAYPRLPDLASAGEPAAASFDFEDVEDERPPGFLKFDGMWEVRGEEDAKPPNTVLLQEMYVDGWALVLATGPGRALADGKVTVRFKPMEGKEDASGGIAFRAQDRKNYYVVRANALERNLRLYVLKDGSRVQLASADVEPPSMGAWHVLEVAFEGDTFKATLDGKASVSAKDKTYARGWTGLWTKADSVTAFDDLRIEPK
jgi:hypothetical protein